MVALVGRLVVRVYRLCVCELSHVTHVNESRLSDLSFPPIYAWVMSHMWYERSDSVDILGIAHVWHDAYADMKYPVMSEIWLMTHDSWLLSYPVICGDMTHDSCLLMRIWKDMTHASLWGYERTWLMTPYEDMKGHDSCLLMRIWKDMTHDSLCRYERSPESCRTCDMERISKESWYQRWIWKESWLCVPMTHSCAHRRQTQTTQTWCHTCDVRRMRKAADTWREMKGVMSHVMNGHESWVMWWMESWVMWWKDMSHESCDEWMWWKESWVISPHMPTDGASPQATCRLSLSALCIWIESCHTCEWVVSHMWMSRVTHVNESCHACEWVISRMWMSHVTHIACECVMTLLWMSRAFVVNESWLWMSHAVTCECVMTSNESRLCRLSRAPAYRWQIPLRMLHPPEIHQIRKIKSLEANSN